MNNEIEYETKLEDGTIITSYLASAHAEGFCEGEDASINNQLKAWSYLIGTGIVWKLQGFYGSTANGLIESNYISKEGILNWELINNDINK